MHPQQEMQCTSVLELFKLSNAREACALQVCATLLEKLLLLLGVGAALEEFKIQSEEMKLNLHWPFKEMSPQKGSWVEAGWKEREREKEERDHCRKRQWILME